MLSPILQGLKSEDHSVRLVCGDRWMTWGTTDKEWQVRQRPYGAKKVLLVCSHKAQAVTMPFLLGKR